MFFLWVTLFSCNLSLLFCWTYYGTQTATPDLVAEVPPLVEFETLAQMDPEYIDWQFSNDIFD